MRIEQKIFNALSPLVGLDADGNKCCYPNTLPQAPTYPAIVFQKIAEEPAFTTTQVARFSDFHFQITIHAATYSAALDLRAQVLVAAEAMPEYVTRLPGFEPPFEFEPKTFSQIVVFDFRDAET